MTEIEKCIVVDLDGTVCDVGHREHLAQAGQWDEFHSLLVNDKPHPDVLFLLQRLGPLTKIVVVSGRSDDNTEATRKWLDRHNILVDLLLLRPKDDWRPDHQLKTQMLEEALGSKEAVLASVVFVLDDRDKVVEAWRNYGLPCWQVRLGTF